MSRRTQFPFRCAPLAAAILLLLAPGLRAELVTYVYSGVSDTNTVLPPIADGTPFSGTFTIDKSAPGTPVGDLVEYPQSVPPAALRLEVAGLTVEATGSGALQLAEFDEIKLVDTFFTTSFTGSGWSFTPSGPANSVGLRSLRATRWRSARS